jgi:DNA-binding CsgD family transcriptional regulator
MHPRDKEIIRQYREGRTLSELAEGYGLSKSGVVVILERNGVKRRRKGAPLKLDAWERLAK